MNRVVLMRAVVRRAWIWIGAMGLALGVAHDVCSAAGRSAESSMLLEVSGKLIGIDAERGMINVMGSGFSDPLGTAPAKPLSFLTDMRTTIVANDEPAQLAQLAVGDTVTIQYVKENRNFVARSITVTQSAAGSELPVSDPASSANEPMPAASERSPQANQPAQAISEPAPAATESPAPPKSP